MTPRRGALLLLLMVIPAAAWWWSRGADPVPAAGPAPAVDARTLPTPGRPAAEASAPVVGRLPGFVPPPLEESTPAERAAMVDAEVERSAAAAPVASYPGIDGRKQAFAYAQTPAQASAQQDEDVRRQAVLEAMRADPARFAELHGLRVREVERMLDGSLEIPEPLLD